MNTWNEIFEQIQKQVEMPTARKQKETSIQHVSEEVIQTLKIIKSCIKKASNAGEFYTLVNVTDELIRNEVCIKFLKDLGYDVTLGIPDPETKKLTPTSIYWKRA